jgi:hypothetical protein
MAHLWMQRITKALILLVKEKVSDFLSSNHASFSNSYLDDLHNHRSNKKAS